jgi:hypothetical protein
METLRTIRADAFKACALPIEIRFPTAPLLGDCAFAGCTSLSAISIPKINVLLCDLDFLTCIPVSALNLHSISIVANSCSSIVAMIKSTFTLVFPASAPQVFASSSCTTISVILVLPSLAPYQACDPSFPVEGDSANDFLWCGIPLVQLYMEVEMAQINTTTATLEFAAESIHISPGVVILIHVFGGCLRASKMDSICTCGPMLHLFVCSTGFLMEKVQFLERHFAVRHHWQLSLLHSTFRSESMF